MLIGIAVNLCTGFGTMIIFTKLIKTVYGMRGLPSSDIFYHLSVC